MKKIPYICLVLVMFMAVPCYALSWEDVINYISGNTKQTGVFYDFDERKVNQEIGLTIPGMKDLFIKKLDASANWDLDKSLIGQLDYRFKEGDVEPYIALGARFDRIEQVLDNDFAVETSFIIAGGVKF